MAKQPKVSIIVTCYNIENYISDCLDGIVSQTLEDIEIIIVDDGSTDATPNIVKSYAKKDKRIKTILMEENSIGGVATAANVGIEAASGVYIGFADGDDVYDTSMFEKLYNAASRYDADLTMCRYKLLDDQSGFLSDPAELRLWNEIKNIRVLNLDEANRAKLLKFISVPWRKLYRRDWILEHGLRFPVGDYFFEDNPFHWFTTLVLKGYSPDTCRSY